MVFLRKRRDPIHTRWARESRVRVTIIRHAESENNVLYLQEKPDASAVRKSDPSLTGTFVDSTA